MTAHAYGRAAVGEDIGLLAALGVAAWALPPGPLASALLIGVPLVLGWGVLTLHFPRRVEIDEAGVAFFAYGRVHRFAWSEVARVRVRRFLVRDRVMVAIAPAGAWRGRYWIRDSIDGYGALVAALEARALTRIARASTPRA
jgi:hypothetical protein